MVIKRLIFVCDGDNCKKELLIEERPAPRLLKSNTRFRIAEENGWSIVRNKQWVISAEKNYCPECTENMLNA